MPMLTQPAERLLARVMGDLSEEYFCAGWLTDCEYALWADLTGQDVAGVQCWNISDEEKKELRLAHEMAGGWIVWSDEDGGRKFLSDEDWLRHLTNRSAESTA
jgi:hypothetical protein